MNRLIKITVLFTGLEIIKISRKPNCIFKSNLKVLCIEISSSLVSLQKFEGAPGEFKGASAIKWKG